MKSFRIDGGCTADYETDFSAKLIQNFLENLAAEVNAEFKEKPCQLDSQGNFLFHSSLFDCGHNLLVNGFYEQRHTEKYGDLVFHDVVLQVFQAIAEGGGGSCSKHDELTCGAEGVVIWKESHAYIAVANVLHLLDSIYIGGYVLLRKHNRL